MLRGPRPVLDAALLPGAVRRVLLHEDRRLGSAALAHDVVEPLKMHRATLRPRLAADNHPRNAHRSPRAIFEIVLSDTPKSAAIDLSASPAARLRRISLTALSVSFAIAFRVPC